MVTGAVRWMGPSAQVISFDRLCTCCFKCGFRRPWSLLLVHHSAKSNPNRAHTPKGTPTATPRGGPCIRPWAAELPLEYRGDVEVVLEEALATGLQYGRDPLVVPSSPSAASV